MSAAQKPLELILARQKPLELILARQKPLELILARSLLSSISTRAFVVGQDGTLLFYNEAAGALIGRPFEETATLTAPERTASFGPFDKDGRPIPYEQVPLTRALRRGRPAHAACSASPARRAEVDRVPLFHHDPLHSDDFLDGLCGEIVARWQKLGGRADQVELATERRKLELAAGATSAAL